MSSPPQVKAFTTKLIKAPLKEVFDWCTDFQEADPDEVTGDPWKIKILEKTPRRVIYEHEHEEKGKLLKQHSVVDINPPNHWHLESRGNMWDSSVDYMLSSEGESTRLTINMVETNKIRSNPNSEAISEWLSGHWDGIIEAFYRDRKRSSQTN
jgi:hypothetical protein